ncbi:MAG: hypothetical protein C0619_05405 [Desulfuromonas sp.]|nr:MAG: hypothetical protein C0619_05405 [Desulfuromonas sp.]
MKQSLIKMLLIALSLTLLTTQSFAQEVNKGEIPADHLAKSLTTLPWGVQVWDIDIALEKLAKDDSCVWIDTRPESFFEKGTLRNAILSPYDKTGKEGNMLTADVLAETISQAGKTKDSATVVFFCQGPKCHRSYNASYVAVSQWGYDPARIAWFRDGYPTTLKKVSTDAKLKRRAKRYLSDAGVDSL